MLNPPKFQKHPLVFADAQAQEHVGLPDFEWPDEQDIQFAEKIKSITLKCSKNLGLAQDTLSYVGVILESDVEQ